MSETEMKIIIDVLGLTLALFTSINAILFFASLKLYTEIMKEKAQRPRP